MFEKVLVPTDFSVYAERMPAFIGDIPGVSEVLLLHVADAAHRSPAGKAPGTYIADAEKRLLQTAGSIQVPGVHVRTMVRVIETEITEGGVAEAILATAADEKVSLVMVGARGRSIKDLLLGSVSSWLLSNSTVPLLLMKYPATSAGKSHRAVAPGLFSTVLLPTDFSLPAAQVISIVKGIRGIKKIVLVHITGEDTGSRETERAIRDAENRLTKLSDGLKGMGFELVTCVRAGYPPDEIDRLAAEEDATLIAMSPHGEGWMRDVRELFIGSTTDAVARRVVRPLLVFPENILA
jgi:nucleotide-binding universal stress UspA family protein